MATLNPTSGHPRHAQTTRVRMLVAGIVTLLVVAAGLLLYTQNSAPQDPAVRALDSINRRRPGNTTSAQIASLQERVQLAPHDSSSYAQLGQAYLQRSRETGDPAYYPKAESVFRKALELETTNFEAMVGMGSLALSRHQFQEALNWGQKASELNPQHAPAYGIIGDALIELGRYDEAAKALEKMVNMRPNTASYSRISYLRELMGDTGNAIQAMEMAARSGRPNSENTAWCLVQVGNLYFNTNNLERADYYYRYALTHMPNYVYALAGQAQVKAAQGDRAGAIAGYERIVQDMPLPEFVIALGDLYRVAGRRDDATRQDELVRAMVRLNKANGVEMDMEVALYEIDHGTNPADALALARQAYAQRPSIRAADVLAWALYRAGQCGEAHTLMQQALRLGTKDALMYYHAGKIAACNGDRAAAQDYFQRALNLNPHFSVLYAPDARKELGVSN